MMNIWRSKLVKSRTVRGSVQPIAATVAATPASGTPASQNSRASAAAVAELIKGLDFVFEQLDFENEPGDLLTLHLERLALEAAKYENAKLIDDAGEQWTFSNEVSRLLYAACQCSSYIYDPKMQSDGELVPVMTRTPSMTGSEKAACIWKMASTGSLIVSIRGTASAADHMVNLNGTPKDASAMFDLGNGSQINAHGGFLACAAILRPTILQDVIRNVQSDPLISQIIFTGHSAGGAVSSLLYLNMLYHTPEELSGMKFALATFGSPPATSISLTEQVRKHPRSSFAVAFANEHDLVTRSDSSYISSIIDLYRSRYGLPSAATDGQTTSPSPAPMLEKATATHGMWTLPPPAYYLVGEIIILRKQMSFSTVVPDDASDAPTISASLEAIKLSPEIFSQVLFCEVSAHKRRFYLERMGMLHSLGRKTTSLLSTADTLSPPDADQFV